MKDVVAESTEDTGERGKRYRYYVTQMMSEAEEGPPYMQIATLPSSKRHIITLA
jgi:hypothetical protein